MTLEQLYGEIGGNYSHAVRIMKMEKMINRYLLKLGSSKVYEGLMEAWEKKDGTAIFESAHAMKGVCANLGLDDLSGKVSVIADEYRPGAARSLSDEEVKAVLDQVSAMYARVEEGIRRYQQG